MSYARATRSVCKLPWRTIRIQETATLLDGIAAPERLRILLALRQQERTPKQLIEDLGLTGAALNYHLTVLRFAGLVSDRRSGISKYYGLTKRGTPLITVVEKLIAIADDRTA
jgi:ArsR family transcriptional regulator